MVADSPRYPIVLGRDFLSTYNITLTPKHAVIPSLLFPVRFIGAYPAYDAVMKVVQNFKERTPPTGLVSTTPYKIKVKTTPTFTPAKLPSYNIDAEEFLQKEVEKLLHEGKIERVSATDSYAVPFAVNKNSTFYRMVVNFKPINDYIQCPPSEFTPIQKLLSGLESSTIFSTLDLKNAFLQIPLHELSRKYTTFRTKSGYYQYTVLPFGLNISPEIFSRTLNDLFGATPFVKCYMDDILVHSANLSDHHDHLQFVLNTLYNSNFW